MMPEWVDHLILGVCQAPIALTLVWLTIRGKFILVNPTVQFCLTLSWTAYVFHHLARIWPNDPTLDALTMHIKAIVAMPLVLFIWPMFRKPDTLPDRIEWERRLSEMSTVAETQKAGYEAQRARVRAVARVCKTQIKRAEQEIERMRMERVNEDFIARASMLNAAFSDILCRLKSEGLDATAEGEHADAVAG